MYSASHPPNLLTPEAMEPADFEFDPLLPTTIELSADAVDWAAQVSQSAADLEQQWQSYIRALALQGLQHWLAAGATQLQTTYDARQIPPATIACRVGDLRLCLLPQESSIDAVVHVPAATVSGPDSAHFYILLEVTEEVERVTVLNSLRRDRLLAYLQSAPLTTSTAEAFPVPVSAFDTPPDTLLLYLNHLSVEQLAPRTAAIAKTAPAGDQQPARSPLPAGLERAINVGDWLQDRLDDVASRLAWTLLAPLAPAHQMMSVSTPEETLETLLQELAPTDLTIPLNARGAYTDLEHAGLPLRLYALTWPLLHDNQPEWSLLLCLGSISGEPLPVGTRLIIRDEAQVLAAPMQQAQDAASYLYGQVIGAWHEQFTAWAEMPNGTIYRWPPFTFQPED